jgi:HSP20 family protein
MSNLAAISNFGLLPNYRVFDEFDSLFDSFLGERRSGSRSLVTTPRANVEETGGGYDIHVAAPGLSREDFKIHADGGYITISADHKEEKASFLSREYSYSSFARSWKLPTGTSSEGITARYDAGVLTVSVPTASKKSSKVEIRVD